ncbi:MAG: aminotransferase class I/II-fold pyridoxal phosphate-dependent enzyme [Planctomycetes bacterium]|nr:aminotransferase class I/II-fold pyridoxal phosphate-dependent enzyme [Planctomycetota bacterium]
MNPLAAKLNETIERHSPAVRALLAPRGERLFFPRGILFQSAEAKKKAHRFNATIGIAVEKGQPMHLASIARHFQGLEPGELYAYAPATGRPDLREAWLAKMRRENPSLGDAPVSLPVVTNALTHGLSVAGDLFVGEGDVLLVPDKFWGNYRLIFETRLGGRIETFPFYEGEGFGVKGLRAALAGGARGRKTIVILNFPSNPTGYMPTPAEMDGIAETLVEAAGRAPLLAILDDAYFGLFHGDDAATESLFGRIASAGERLLAVRLDGATKEEFVWGFRTGFITYGIKGGAPELYEALVAKTAGAIRGSISNCPLPSQSIVLRALRDPAFAAERDAKRAILRERARVAKREALDPKYADLWDLYPFNAGYFLCVRVKGVDAEALRVHLLDAHGLGTISIGSEDLRIAFSSIEKEDIPAVFALVAQGIRELRAGKD